MGVARDAKQLVGPHRTSERCHRAATSCTHCDVYGFASSTRKMSVEEFHSGSVHAHRHTWADGPRLGVPYRTASQNSKPPTKEARRTTPIIEIHCLITRNKRGLPEVRPTRRHTAEEDDEEETAATGEEERPPPPIPLLPIISRTESRKAAPELSFSMTSAYKRNRCGVVYT